MLFVPLQLVQRVDKRLDVEGHSIAEAALESSRKVNRALDVVVKLALCLPGFSDLFHVANHLRRDRDTRLGARACARAGK